MRTESTWDYDFDFSLSFNFISQFSFKNTADRRDHFNLKFWLLMSFSFTVAFLSCRPGETPLLLPQGDGQQPDLVRCSRHMCPIRVHWHVKTSYREYWRVKITVTNLNLVKNYSAWNLVVLHPNLQSITQVFSFNYRSLNEHGTISKWNHIPLYL